MPNIFWPRTLANLLEATCQWVWPLHILAHIYSYACIHKHTHPFPLTHPNTNSSFFFLKFSLKDIANWHLFKKRFCRSLDNKMLTLHSFRKSLSWVSFRYYKCILLIKSPGKTTIKVKATISISKRTSRNSNIAEKAAVLANVIWVAEMSPQQ